MEKVVTVSVPLALFFPHNKLFSQLFFQLNCYSPGHASRPPSVNEGNKVLPPPLPSTIDGEGGDGEFSSCF
jgi:hypothetical protein